MVNKSARTRGRHATPQCLDVQSWRVPTKEETLAWLEKAGPEKRSKRTVLMVRQHLSPVDVYCYLKARFGEPNGFQNWLRQDTSDNWIHWDYYLKTGEQA